MATAPIFSGTESVTLATAIASQVANFEVNIRLHHTRDFMKSTSRRFNSPNYTVDHAVCTCGREFRSRHGNVSLGVHAQAENKKSWGTWDKVYDAMIEEWRNAR